MNKDGCYNKQCVMFTDMMPANMNCAFNWINGPEDGCDKYQAAAASGSTVAPGYADIVETLREMVGVQCNNGNWNYDQYMHGMANGMIFSLSLFDDKRPEYLEAPDKWLEDMPNTDKPRVVATEA